MGRQKGEGGRRNGKGAGGGGLKVKMEMGRGESKRGCASEGA